MRILFIKPPSKTHIIIPPIGLGYLAAYCGNHHVKILDCLKEGMNFNDFRRFVLRHNFNVYCFSAFSMEINSALRCASIVKSVNKRYITVLGGSHVSALPLEILSNNGIDFVFVGEAEMGFPFLLKAIEGKYKLEDIPGVGYKKNGDIKINKPKFIDDLDSIRFPRWNLMNLREYPRVYTAKRYPIAPIITSRGCPFSCTFCAGHIVSGKKWRYRSPENIIKEIKLLKRMYGVKEIAIWDDNFTLDKDRAIRFFKLLFKENLDVIVSFPNGVRYETLDEELLSLMKKGGCYELGIGIESGSKRILQDMKKKLNLEDVTGVVDLVNKFKIRLGAFFIIGYPTETKEDIIATIKFAKKLKIKRARFSLYQPLPGSESYFELVKQGKVKKNMDWSKCEYSSSIIVPDKIKDINELKRLQRKALLEFYLRPPILIRFILDNLSLSQIKESFQIFKEYVLKNK